MIIPLVKSKFIIPEISDKALYSKRLKDLGIADRHATVITAPAGFGKTTAVILALQHEREHIRWYRMEKDDAFFPLFYAHLIDTLFPDHDRASLDCVRSLSSLNNVAEEYLLQNALICQDAWSLYAEMRHPLYLVLDDFQNVLDNPMIAESMRYFIMNMPDCVRIIVMSRIETGIYSGKMACDQQCSFINEQALRFTEEETKTLLSEKYNRKLSAAHIKHIYSYSEGWIAGLTMMCHIDDPQFFMRGKIVPGALPHDQTGQFRHYFSEFLSRVDAATMLNLAKISILPDFSCNDLAAIFCIHNAEEIVTWLDRATYTFKNLPQRL